MPPFPNALIVRAFVRRALWLWVTARLVISAVMRLGGLMPMSPSLSLRVVLIVGVLLFVDVGRRHERMLLANLGISRSQLLAICVIPVMLSEMGLQLVASIIASAARA